ncbi:MAG: hypothetical protein ACP5KN_15155, partial [Armatimonadota bacterium]
ADGDPGNVVVELFEGQDKIMDGMVSETKQLEGWYRYVIGPRPVTGSYTVKARYDPPEGEEQVDDGPVSVPNDCGAVVADPRNIVTEIDPGAHQVTWGPEFTFTVQPEGPMW